MPNFLKSRLFREQIFQKRDSFQNQNRDPQKIGKSLETVMSHSDKRTRRGGRRRHEAEKSFQESGNNIKNENVKFDKNIFIALHLVDAVLTVCDKIC